MNYLLDTNIILTYLRNNNVTEIIENQFGLLSGRHNLIISVVSLGEIKAIAKKRNWGVLRNQRLDTLLKNFLVTKINRTEIIDAYAEIDAYSQNKLVDKPLPLTARNMGKNDLWIAATAYHYRIPFITMDSDFDHLADTFLTLEKVAF